MCVVWKSRFDVRTVNGRVKLFFDRLNKTLSLQSGNQFFGFKRVTDRVQIELFIGSLSFELICKLLQYLNKLINRARGNEGLIRVEKVVVLGKVSFSTRINLGLTCSLCFALSTSYLVSSWIRAFTNSSRSCSLLSTNKMNCDNSARCSLANSNLNNFSRTKCRSSAALLCNRSNTKAKRVPYTPLSGTNEDIG